MSSSRRPAQSSDSFNPRHSDEITLMCLNGEIEEPSKQDADHYKRRLSLIEWCDRMLTPDEQRVSSPREKKWARIGHLSTMRSVWADRLAGERAAQARAQAQASKRTEVGRTPSVRRFFGELSRAIEAMIFDEGASTREKRQAVLPKTVDNLISRAETFLTDTEIILSEAQDIIRIDNELEREVVTKFRHTLVHLKCQVTARCKEEGFNIDLESTHTQTHTQTPRHPDCKMANTNSKLTKPSKEEHELDPAAEEYKPRCRPVTADEIANPHNYHTCGCDKKAVVECEHCLGDKVFCDPYKW